MKHDPNGQLLFISVQEPYMTHGSLGPVPASLPTALDTEHVDQRKNWYWTSLTRGHVFFCFLGPTGSNKSSI